MAMEATEWGDFIYIVMPLSLWWVGFQLSGMYNTTSTTGINVCLRW